MSAYSGVHIIDGVKAIWLQNVGYVAAKPIEEFRSGDIIAYNDAGTGIFISKKEVSPKFWEIVTKEEDDGKIYHSKVKKGTLKPYYKPRKNVTKAAAPPARTPAAEPAAKPTPAELAHAKELGKVGYWAGKRAPAQDAKILDMCRQRPHDAMMALMTAWSKGWHAEHQKESDRELVGKGLIMPGMEAATKPPRTPAAASDMASVPVRLGGGGIAPIPGMGAAAAPKPKQAAKPAKKAAAPKPKRRQPAAEPATKAATKKPKPPVKAKKAAAKPAKAKNGKPAPELTAAQRKRLAAKGSITIKRNGKFVTITR